MRIMFFLLALAPMMLFASEAESAKDIIPRTLNFILFFAILYYFIADPIRNFFVGRADNIANELDKVQAKLMESKKSLHIAQQNLEDAKKLAKEIIDNAHKEALSIKEQIQENTAKEIDSIVKQHNDAMAFERRRVEQAVIKEILKELFESDALRLDKDSYAEILLKKVA